jgi:pilus assembly protein Flp/PilA
MDMKSQLVQFWKDEEGATAIEYALIAGLIAAAIVVGAGLVGTNLNAFFNKIASLVSDKTPA